MTEMGWDATAMEEDNHDGRAYLGTAGSESWARFPRDVCRTITAGVTPPTSRCNMRDTGLEGR